MSTPNQVSQADDTDASNANANANANDGTKTMVDVKAPSTLKEGYKFKAVHDHQVFEVTVPAGGVTEGQIFWVPFVATPSSTATSTGTAVATGVTTGVAETSPLLASSSGSGPATSNDDAKQRSWQNSLFGCFSGDIFQTVCGALCFPQILLGVVQTRLKLDWRGNNSGNAASENTTCTWILLTIASFVAIFVSSMCSLNGFLYGDSQLDGDGDGAMDLALTAASVHAFAEAGCSVDTVLVLDAVKWAWVIVPVLVLAKTRAYVRSIYHIPRSFPCEDLVVATACGCCAVSQLARQTQDYGQLAMEY
eukprot:jgi/Psemu1/182120/e_gw1.24.79.1